MSDHKCKYPDCDKDSIEGFTLCNYHRIIWEAAANSRIEKERPILIGSMYCVHYCGCSDLIYLAPDRNRIYVFHTITFRGSTTKNPEYLPIDVDPANLGLAAEQLKEHAKGRIIDGLGLTVEFELMITEQGENNVSTELHEGSQESPKEALEESS